MKIEASVVLKDGGEEFEVHGKSDCNDPGKAMLGLMTLHLFKSSHDREY